MHGGGRSYKGPLVPLNKPFVQAEGQVSLNGTQTMVCLKSQKIQASRLGKGPITKYIGPPLLNWHCLVLRLNYRVMSAWKISLMPFDH